MPQVADALADMVGQAPRGSAGLLLIGVLGALSFAVSLVTRRWLPISEVVAFLVVGVVLGSRGLGVLDRSTVAHLQPLIAVALGAMVFVIGERLQLPALRPIRHTLVPMAVVGNLATFAVTFVVLLAVGLSTQVAYVLAAIAPSTAPVTVRALVAEREAKGPFTDHLLAATALNNVTSALLFGLGAPVVFATLGPHGQVLASIAQLLGAALGIGLVAGVAMVLTARVVSTAGQRFLLVWVMLVLTVGAVRYVGSSVVITTLVLGAVVANLARDARPLFDQIRVLEAPIFLVFFVVTGADVRIDRFLTLGAFGAAYVLARAVGRVGGAWLGLSLTRSGRALGWRHRTGLAQLPYAGMAVGLASFSVEKASQVGAESIGQSVAALILGSVFIFEVITPMLLDRALAGVGESGVEREPAEAPAVAREREAVRHVLVAVGREAHVMALAKAAISVAASGRTALTALAADPEGTWRGRAQNQPAIALFSQLAADHGLAVNAVVRRAETLEAAILAEARHGAVDLVIVGEARQADRARRIREALAGQAEVMVVPTKPSEEPPEPAPQPVGRGPVFRRGG